MQTLKSTSTSSAHFGYIDILRIFSCILIIGVHVSAMNWGDAPVTSSQWQFMNFYDCLSLLGVPLFFMISGALFLNEHHNISLCDLFFRKILRLSVTMYGYYFTTVFLSLLANYLLILLRSKMNYF